MNSFRSEKTFTRSLTQTVVGFFLSLKKSPSSSPEKTSTDNVHAPPSIGTNSKFKSFALNQQDVRKIQLQGARRKKRVRSQKSRQSTNCKEAEIGDYFSPISYEQMALERIGIDGPVNPYMITKVRDSFNASNEFSSIQARSFYSHGNDSSLSVQSTVQPNITYSRLTNKDVKRIIEVSAGWCASPTWTGKRMGFRAAKTEKFRSRFRSLESEVYQFQLDFNEIHENLADTCRGILEKQMATSEFLDFTSIYAHMLEPIEKDLKRLEEIIDLNDITLTVESVNRVKESYLEVDTEYRQLPEFSDASRNKRVIADENIFGLNSYLALLGNHKNHERKISEKFRVLHLQYGSYGYLMREYIWQLFFHFDFLRKGSLESTWYKFFKKFKLSLEKSTRENGDAHEMMNLIIIQRKSIERRMHYIDKRLYFLYMELVRDQN